MSGLLCYVFGVPGSGKSTVMRSLTGDRESEQLSKPVPHRVLTGSEDGLPPVICELGRDRPGFPGTDTLAMNIQPQVGAFLETCLYPLVLGEGDRLANEPFFALAAEKGWQVKRVWLDCPESLAALRRAERGSRQSASWLKGRQTKVFALGQKADLVLHGAVPASQNALFLRQKIRRWLEEEAAERDNT